MATKGWVDLPDFAEALRIARRRERLEVVTPKWAERSCSFETMTCQALAPRERSRLRSARKAARARVFAAIKAAKLASGSGLETGVTRR